MKPITTREPVRSAADTNRTAELNNDFIRAKKEVVKQYREWRKRMKKEYGNSC